MKGQFVYDTPYYYGIWDLGFKKLTYIFGIWDIWGVKLFGIWGKYLGFGI